MHIQVSIYPPTFLEDLNLFFKTIAEFKQGYLVIVSKDNKLKPILFSSLTFSIKTFFCLSEEDNEMILNLIDKLEKQDEMKQVNPDSNLILTMIDCFGKNDSKEKTKIYDFSSFKNEKTG